MLLLNTNKSKNITKYVFWNITIQEIENIFS